jgi:uncharacterized protein YegL
MNHELPSPPALSEIAFILDRSGSMEAMRQAAIDGFNEFLADQQAAPGQARLTLVLFDNRIEIPIDHLPIPEVLPLDHDTFVPRGSTALLDAIGITIDTMARRIKHLPAGERPQHVAVAILTDGEENSSTRFTWHDIAARIARLTDEQGWDFLFLGAGPDAIATAARMNIRASSSATYFSDAHGHTAASKSLSRKISSSRSLKSGQASAEARRDAEAPLQAIVQEEDQKRRDSGS